MKKILILLILFMVFISACSPKNFELEKNQSKWQAADISHYRFSLMVGCFCAFSDKMPLSIEVKDGKIISMFYNDGTVISDSDRMNFSQYATIPTLFSFTKDVLKKADEVNIQYNEKYGFPSSVQVDYIKNAADDELSLTVMNFQPQ